jgi:hypothetical protein
MYIDIGMDNLRGVMSEILFGRWDKIKCTAKVHGTQVSCVKINVVQCVRMDCEHHIHMEVW